MIIYVFLNLVTVYCKHESLMLMHFYPKKFLEGFQNGSKKRKLKGGVKGNTKIFWDLLWFLHRCILIQEYLNGITIFLSNRNWYVITFLFPYKEL